MSAIIRYIDVQYQKIQAPPLQRNHIIARDQKSNLHVMSFQSSPKINCMLITTPIYIQWKFRTPNYHSFAKIHIFFFNHWVYSLLVANFQKSPKFHLSKASEKMYDFNQAIILSSRFHNLCKECLAQWPPFSVLNTTKTLFQITSLAAYTSKTNNMHNKLMTNTVITPFCITIG